MSAGPRAKRCPVPVTDHKPCACTVCAHSSSVVRLSRFVRRPSSELPPPISCLLPHMHRRRRRAGGEASRCGRVREAPGRQAVLLDPQSRRAGWRVSGGGQGSVGQLCALWWVGGSGRLMTGRPRLWAWPVWALGRGVGSGLSSSEHSPKGPSVRGRRRPDRRAPRRRRHLLPLPPRTWRAAQQQGGQRVSRAFQGV